MNWKNIFLKTAREAKHVLFFSYLRLKTQYRKLIHKPVIYVFGDSHSRSLQHELFIVNHVGPATAFKLPSDTSTTQAKKKIYISLKKFFPTKRYLILFMFGEIDCRIHINKISIITKRPLEAVVKDTVLSYGEFLRTVKTDYPNSTIMVLNVFPPGEEKNIYNTKFYPSRSLHMKIVRMFNATLEKFCSENNFLFLSVFEELINESGIRLKEYVFDNVHYNKNINPLIIKELKYKKVI